MELIARVAHARDTVVVSIGGAGGDCYTFASQVLGSCNAHASLKSGIISLVLVTVRSSGADNAISIDVSYVSQVAFAGYTVEGFIGSALSAST